MRTKKNRKSKSNLNLFSQAIITCLLIIIICHLLTIICRLLTIICHLLPIISDFLLKNIPIILLDLVATKGKEDTDGAALIANFLNSSVGMIIGEESKVELNNGETLLKIG